MKVWEKLLYIHAYESKKHKKHVGWYHLQEKSTGRLGNGDKRSLRDTIEFEAAS